MEILDWTYKLQIELEQLTQEEFVEYMKDKQIRFEGKLYSMENKNETVQRKDN